MSTAIQATCSSLGCSTSIKGVSSSARTKASSQTSLKVSCRLGQMTSSVDHESHLKAFLGGSKAFNRVHNRQKVQRSVSANAKPEKKDDLLSRFVDDDPTSGE